MKSVTFSFGHLIGLLVLDLDKPKKKKSCIKNTPTKNALHAVKVTG